jgi:hypothetical protein
VRRLFSLVSLCSLAAAMSLAAVPRQAAAAVQTETNFNLTINGPSPVGETFQLILLTPTNKGGQPLVFCAPNVPPTPTQGPVLPCQGGGKTYSITWSTPAGLKASYRFERVAADGAVTILWQGTFTARVGGPLVSQQQTFNVTYNVATLPNTAMAPKADRPEAVLPALGMGMLLIAATLLVGTARRKREQPLLGHGTERAEDRG